MSAARNKSPAIGEPGWRPTEVHPFATAFRMMTDGELDDLAADIKEHGLRVPIIVDQDGRVVDGRNRDAACARAGVEPRYQMLDGEDMAALVVSLNLQRRDLNEGQRAIGLARIYPEPEKGGRGDKGALKEAAKRGGFSDDRLTQARSILRHSRELAEQVRDGFVFFDTALNEVEQARAASQSSETQLAELREHAPDLADLVVEERLPLGEAHSAYKKRQADIAAAEANKREVMLRLSESAWQATTAWASDEFVAEISERLEDADFRRRWLDRLRFDPARLGDVQRGAMALANLLGRINKEGNNV